MNEREQVMWDALHSIIRIYDAHEYSYQSDACEMRGRSILAIAKVKLLIERMAEKVEAKPVLDFSNPYPELTQDEVDELEKLFKD